MWEILYWKVKIVISSLFSLWIYASYTTEFKNNVMMNLLLLKQK